MTFDLADPRILLREDVLTDPRPLYDVLRREAPVWGIPGQDSYLVADPGLIREAVARTSEFSSNLVSVLHRGDDGGLVDFGVTPFGDPVNTLATADPPVHTRHRRVLQGHLSPAALSALEPLLAGIVDEQLAPMLLAGSGDFVSCVSDPVPGRAICQVIGLPQTDAPRLIELVGGIAKMLDGVTDLDGMSQAAMSALDLLVYAQEKLDNALRHPSERAGLLAMLADAVGDRTLSSDEARDLVVLLINAGTETTSSLISTTVRTLATRSHLQAHLRQNPEEIPGAIEQILRDDGPFQFHYRWTTTDAVLGDYRIPANSRVLLMWAAANRPTPNGSGGGSSEPDDRGQAPHFAFGRGLHFCIGAHLARLEGRLVIGHLLARTSAFALDPDQRPSLRPSIFLRRHDSLPVLLDGPHR
jgi:cytochrome P450